MIPEEGGEVKPVIIHANIASMVLGEDDLVIELREWHPAHVDVVDLKDPEKLRTVAVLQPDGFKKLPPKGTVILSFAAAYALQNYLNRTMPMMLKSRAAPRPNPESAAS